MKRTLAIGDIHSGLRGLVQLIEKAKVSSEDHLIFLGDYVDGWSTAVETVEFLMQLNKSHRCTFIRGNHDELVYDWLKDGKETSTWHQHGGEATKASYNQAGQEIKNKHLSFYEGLENYYLDQANRLFLHAGFTNLKGVDFEYFKKTFYWDRTLWELAQSLDPSLKPDHVRYPQRLKQYAEVYIGHTPISKTAAQVVPKNAATIWNVDTGAAFKGPLSMIDIETKEVWQSDTLQSLYPNENGRN